MTLTKYQRGESIEGWNDCPVYIPSSSSTSSLNSGSSRTSRKRPPRRLGHNINGTPISSRSATPVSIPTPTPPIPARNLSSSINLDRDLKPINNPSGKKDQADTEGDTDIDDTSINTMLDDLLRHPSTLQVNEIKHYQSKLKNVVSMLKGNDKLFLNDILVKVLRVPSDGYGRSIANIKQEILMYMMANQGVSTWCVPLKKTIEGLKINT
ncbi:unnamed protein product [Debaryomyces tyrocola]|nr:unnamed protein product [Debaryomyces tyrocola]